MVTEAAGLLVMDKHLLGTEEALSKAVPSIHPVHIQMLLNAWRPDEYSPLSLSLSAPVLRLSMLVQELKKKTM